MRLLTWRMDGASQLHGRQRESHGQGAPHPEHMSQGHSHNAPDQAAHQRAHCTYKSEYQLPDAVMEARQTGQWIAAIQRAAPGRGPLHMQSKRSIACCCHGSKTCQVNEFANMQHAAPGRGMPQACNPSLMHVAGLGGVSRGKKSLWSAARRHCCMHHNAWTSKFNSMHLRLVANIMTGYCNGIL